MDEKDYLMAFKRCIEKKIQPFRRGRSRYDPIFLYYFFNSALPRRDVT